MLFPKVKCGRTRIIWQILNLFSISSLKIRSKYYLIRKTVGAPSCDIYFALEEYLEDTKNPQY